MFAYYLFYNWLLIFPFIGEKSVNDNIYHTFTITVTTFKGF
jgi:hypothetical protein